MGGRQNWFDNQLLFRKSSLHTSTGKCAKSDYSIGQYAEVKIGALCHILQTNPHFVAYVTLNSFKLFTQRGLKNIKKRTSSANSMKKKLSIDTNFDPC
jgi:hypothetical protein